MCLVKFALSNKIKAYFHIPYLDKLNLGGSVVRITSKKIKMFVLFEFFQTVFIMTPRWGCF